MIHPSLIHRLRALSRHEHSDTTIGDEAADEIERLQAEGDRQQTVIRSVNGRCDHLGIRLGELIRERDALRDAIAAARAALTPQAQPGEHGA